MNEQRRHHRIRFSKQPVVRLGQYGFAGSGALENLSLIGCMIRSDLPLRSGEAFGCEFSVFDSPLIDVPAVVVSKMGNLYGARLQTGPLSEALLQEAIDHALARGHASVLSINDLQGRKVMRVVGGLNVCLRDDFLHRLANMKVDDLDLAAVTEIDREGVALCRTAVEDYKIQLVQASACVRTVLGGRLTSS